MNLSAYRSFLDREHEHGSLTLAASDFLWFGFKQAWACVFGALLLLGVFASTPWVPQGIHRYDLLFAYAITIQLSLLAFKMESWREFCVVIFFHVLATGMELFKTSDAIGSWAYPGDAIVRLGNVPLFAGFMYSAVGSYMARIWRLFDMRFEQFPSTGIAFGIAALSYLNFFSHHYLPDIRWLLILASALAFGRTTVIFRPHKTDRRMPLLLGFALVALFIWIAENIATFTRVWIYPNQHQEWAMVGLGKLTSWFLLMQLSFILIYVLRQIEARSAGRRHLGRQRS